MKKDKEIMSNQTTGRLKPFYMQIILTYKITTLLSSSVGKSPPAFTNLNVYLPRSLLVMLLWEFFNLFKTKKKSKTKQEKPENSAWHF